MLASIEARILVLVLLLPITVVLDMPRHQYQQGTFDFTNLYLFQGLCNSPFLEQRMELFVDYGYEYFESRPENYGPIPREEHYEEGDEFIQSFQNLADSIGWSFPLCGHGENCMQNKLDSTPWENLQNLLDLILFLKDTFFSPVLATLPQNAEVLDYVADQGVRYSEYNRSIRTIEWLKEHGTCMDNLQPGQSTIPQAGRGAFARRNIAQGDVVAPLPLIHANRNLLDMYGPFHESPVHQQLLINYCFGHSDTDLLLCPYGVGTALVNHSRERHNAQLVWSDKSTRRPEWLLQHPSQWMNEMTAGLAFDIVATRDIRMGEEVLIDYGEEWQTAWNRHQRDWKPPLDADTYIPAYMLDLEQKLRTVAEGSYSSKDKENLCRDEFRALAGLEASEYHFHACRIAHRYLDDTTGEYRYTAEIVDRLELMQEDGEYEMCIEVLTEVLFDVPRECFYIEDSFYSRDHAMPWAFRHDIRIPDYLIPDAWIDDGDGVDW